MKNFTILLALLFSNCAYMMLTGPEAAFTKKFGRDAQDMGRSFKVAPSAILATAMLISHSDMAPEGNNLFMVQVDSTWTGPSFIRDSTHYKSYTNSMTGFSDACIKAGVKATDSHEVCTQVFLRYWADNQVIIRQERFLSLVEEMVGVYGLEYFD